MLSSLRRDARAAAPTFGVAFVGSSNVSRSALETGIEWNLRVERAIDPIAYGSVHAAVDGLWGTASELTASWIQKLCRPENLARIAAERFDYVVIDEAHHADAPSYRRLLDALAPTFLLGITATPERADEGDILGMFDDFVAYRADLGVGIQKGRLVPFAYHGVRDDIDYAQLPWRNRRFEPAALAAAAQTQRRMERLWGAWREYPGTRSLVFCCSIEHARFAADWLRERSVGERNVRVDAVFAGPGSADPRGPGSRGRQHDERARRLPPPPLSEASAHTGQLSGWRTPQNDHSTGGAAASARVLTLFFATKLTGCRSSGCNAYLSGMNRLDFEGFTRSAG